MKHFVYGAVAALSLTLAACAPADNETSDASASLPIDYEKYELDNGLDVVRHGDHSDPVAAGDARTQRDRLRALGLGEPIMVDRQGERVR